MCNRSVFTHTNNKIKKALVSSVYTNDKISKKVIQKDNTMITTK
jgi:hypothetical protein